VQNRELPMDWGDRKLALTQPGDVVERGAMKAANQVVAGSVVPSIPALSGPIVARLTEAESREPITRSNQIGPALDVKTPSLSSPAQPAASLSTTWQNRLFSARIMGSEDDRRIDFTLDRDGGKITGSFAIHGTGHGNITKGEFNPKDKSSPLRLECVFTDRELKGQTRVLDGWFLYATATDKRDENNDGKDDQSKHVLPLLIGGVWKGGTKEHKLDPVSPTAEAQGNQKGKKDDKALEEAIIKALPEAMLKTGTPKQIQDTDARANIPLVLAECKHAGITDPRDIAYILVTAAWESMMGGMMYENPNQNVMKAQGLTEEAYFNRKYGSRLGNGDASSGDGFKYRGRGFVQLTGRELYKKATAHCKALDFKVEGSHPDLLENPDLVATNKPLAALILVFGMKEGWFTGVGLNAFTKGHTESEMRPQGQLDFNEARWVVNGNDDASKKPMGQAADSLAKTIDGADGAGQNDDGPKRIPQEEYDLLRRGERDGFDSDELKRIRAGIQTGSQDGVPGYYNGPNEATTWGSHTSSDGFYYGEKWQCVEYVRRYYHDALSHDVTKRGDARTWFTDGLEDGGSTFDGLVQYNHAGAGAKSDDGFSVKPQKGDILVLKTGSYGHVAIVAEVSDTKVTIAQQNVVGDGFTSDIKMKKEPTGKWRLTEKHPLGLLRKS
jgi:predicted chitinase